MKFLLGEGGTTPLHAMHVEQLAENYAYVSEIAAKLTFFREHTKNHDLKFLMSLTDFQPLSANIVLVRGGENGMTIAYLRSVSALVSLVAAVCERGLILHADRKRYGKIHFCL